MWLLIVVKSVPMKRLWFLLSFIAVGSVQAYNNSYIYNNITTSACYILHSTWQKGSKWQASWAYLYLSRLMSKSDISHLFVVWAESDSWLLWQQSDKKLACVTFLSEAIWMCIVNLLCLTQEWFWNENQCKLQLQLVSFLSKINIHVYIAH